MTLLICKFQKMIRKDGFNRKGSKSKTKAPEKSNINECYKCGSDDNISRSYPMWVIE